MALSYFKQKLEEGYWVRGSVWEFDWYLDVFFAEEMSFGKYPFHIGYEQPIIGDEYLDLASWDRSLPEFRQFFENYSRVSKLIADQKAILTSSDRVILELRKGLFNAKRYELVQRHLTLLMASVSVVFDTLISEQVKRIAEREGLKEDDVSGFIIDQSSHTKLNESNNALLKLSRESGDGINKRLKQHVAQFGWLNTGEKGVAEWTAKDFSSQLKSLVATGREKASINGTLRLNGQVNRRAINDIIRISLNDNLAADKQIELDFLFQKYLGFKLGNYYKEAILENLTYGEILKVIDNPQRVRNFQIRNSNNMRVIWPEKGRALIHYFNERKDYDNLTSLVKRRPEGESEIRGNIACRGRVRGRARIVETQLDLESFRDGEVLVAVKTQPKYVPVMTKAAAIVTDIGGITSHAAIISREFEIPCIVGTGNATKILKNGDLILVDADLGVVTKLD